MFPDQGYQDQPRTVPQTARVAHHIIKHGSPRLVIFALIAGLLGIAVSAASLTFFLSYRTTVTAQMHQLQEAVSNAQAGNQSNISRLNGLSGKVGGIGATLNTLVGDVAPFNKVCSQDLTGPNGPAQFFFTCTDQKP